MSEEEITEELSQDLSEGIDGWLEELKSEFPTAQVEVISSGETARPSTSNTASCVELSTDVILSSTFLEESQEKSEHNYSRPSRFQETCNGRLNNSGNSSLTLTEYWNDIEDKEVYHVNENEKQQPDSVNDVGIFLKMQLFIMRRG